MYQLPEPNFDVSTYDLRRNEDNSTTRIEGRVETQEPNHKSNIEFHAQALANALAQDEKLTSFEIENPPIEPELEEVPEESPEEVPTEETAEEE